MYVYGYEIDMSSQSTSHLSVLVFPPSVSLFLSCVSVRLRDPGLAWSYYSTDPEWGLMQARSLIGELETALTAHEVCRFISVF
jgi:hypothetical protein